MSATVMDVRTTTSGAAAVCELPVGRPGMVWRFTVTHGPLDQPGRRCINGLDTIARSDSHFVECRRLHESSSWIFEGKAGVIITALHGLAVNEGQHFWRLETLVGLR